ncbi:MAG: hypothetical protein M3R17_00445 [Bacteroidota bacterium]|nr:hypothetical protein [Bacteroidota bacterium]
MKYILLIGFSALILTSCGPGPGKIVVVDSAALKDSIARLHPETPHEVMKGKDASYAFMPDTAIQSIILGNPDCLKEYYRQNGSNKSAIGKRYAVAYYTSSVDKKQEMEIRVTDNTQREEVPYAIIVQRKGEEHSPELSVRSIPSSDFNFVSGHGVYIGMPLHYVMSVYSNQSFMEWEKGDTVYLQYKPKPKDTNYFKRYKPESYTVTYKFVDESLRRMEYYVDPEQFENK